MAFAWLVSQSAALLQAAPEAAPGAQAPAVAPAGEKRVGKFLRLDAPINDKTNERVRRAVDAFVEQAKRRGEWPVVVLEFETGRTPFGAALDLAKYLTGPSLNGATTVA